MTRLSEEGLNTFLSSAYTVTQRSDRMGYVLEGPTIQHRKGPDIISDGTAFGSIQVPGSGQPIILLADRQTTGGYVKIATVITCDLPMITQALPGYEVRFRTVGLQQAQELVNSEEKRPWLSSWTEWGDGSFQPARRQKMKIDMSPIGIIHSPFKTKDACPIQPVYASEAEGRVEVFEEYTAGLKDIETFSHLYLLYRFDRSGEIRLVRPTFLDDQPHGIYASRHPCRPNGIGLSIVALKRRDQNLLWISGVDVLDGTPLLDIKPYLPRFDCFPEASEGWFKDKLWRPKPAGRE